MVSINSLVYSQYFPKRTFEDSTKAEIDIFMDNFIEDGMSTDLYDIKYLNDAIMDYDVEEKLSNIQAKTLIFISSDDTYYSPESDGYALTEKIESVKIIPFDASDFIFSDDYSRFVKPIGEFLETFKK